MSACRWCDYGDPHCRMCHPHSDPSFKKPWGRLEYAIYAFDRENKFPWEQLMKSNPVGETWRIVPAWTDGKIGLMLCQLK